MPLHHNGVEQTTSADQLKWNGQYAGQRLGHNAAFNCHTELNTAKSIIAWADNDGLDGW